MVDHRLLRRHRLSRGTEQSISLPNTCAGPTQRHKASGERAGVGRVRSTIDDDTIRLLGELPADLLERGWVLSPSEVWVAKATPWHRAIYVRPYDDHRDDQPVTSATYDKQTRRRILRISTHLDRSPSWRDARQDAIRRLREVDAKYSREQRDG